MWPKLRTTVPLENAGTRFQLICIFDFTQILFFIQALSHFAKGANMPGAPGSSLWLSGKMCTVPKGFIVCFVLTPLVMYRSLCRLEDYKMLLYFTVTWHLKPRCLGIQHFHCYFLRDFICSQLQNTFSSRSLPAAGISLHSCPSILWCLHPSSTHLGTLIASRDFHSVPDDPDEILVNEHFRVKLTCFWAVDSKLRGREAEYIGSSGGQRRNGPCLLLSPHPPEAVV